MLYSTASLVHHGQRAGQAHDHRVDLRVGLAAEAVFGGGEHLGARWRAGRGSPGRRGASCWRRWAWRPVYGLPKPGRNAAQVWLRGATSARTRPEPRCGPASRSVANILHGRGSDLCRPTPSPTPPARALRLDAEAAYASLVPTAPRAAARPMLERARRRRGREEGRPLTRTWTAARRAALWLWHDFLPESHAISQGGRDARGQFVARHPAPPRGGLLQREILVPPGRAGTPLFPALGGGGERGHARRAGGQAVVLAHARRVGPVRLRRPVRGGPRRPEADPRHAGWRSRCSRRSGACSSTRASARRELLSRPSPGCAAGNSECVLLRSPPAARS